MLKVSEASVQYPISTDDVLLVRINVPQVPSVIADGPHHYHPACGRSLRIFPSLPGSRLPIFLSRCKFSTLTTRQPMVELYLLTFPRFPLRKKEHTSYFDKNRTHDFRTSRCAGYLLDHSGDERCLRAGFPRKRQSTKHHPTNAHTPLLSLTLPSFSWYIHPHKNRLTIKTINITLDQTNRLYIYIYTQNIED